MRSSCLETFLPVARGDGGVPNATSTNHYGNNERRDRTGCDRVIAHTIADCVNGS